jgi:hypothetical protein
MQDLEYNADTGEFLRRHAGGLNKEGYRYISIDGRSYRASRLAYLYMTGEWPEHQIDHKNVNPGDDSWDNLREATQSQNKRNSKKYKNNTTGYKCVYWDADRNCYTVRMAMNGKRLRLGRYSTIEEAHQAYLAKVQELHGEFANTG